MVYKKLAVIGVGQMGQALIRSFVREFMRPENIFLYDIDENKAIAAAAESGCRIIRNSEFSIISECQAVILAVKPQNIKAAVSGLHRIVHDETVVISIAAGISTDTLRANGFKHQPLARVMPNTPALVGAAVSGIAFNNISDDQKQWVIELFASCGLALEVPENLLDAITGLSGSGPAYVMMIIEALADAGVKQGLTRTQSMQIAAMTVYGSAKLVIDTGTHPAMLKDQVCSPGGTTIDAVASLEKNGLRNALIEAVTIAADKSRQLSGAGDNK